MSHDRQASLFSRPSIDRPPRHVDWVWAVAIMAGIFAVYLLLADGSTLFDRDEPRFARSAVEMVRSGDYLVPHFEDELRPDKPILIYWLMSVPIHLFGVTTLAVRLPSVLMTALAALVTFWIGRRLYGPRTGLLAMVVLATSPLMMLDGGAAISDPLLLLTLTLSFAVALVGLERGFSWPLTVGLGLTLGLGQLAKGPVALAVVGLGVLAAIWLMPRPAASTGDGGEAGDAAATGYDRRHRRRQSLRVLAAGGISVLIFLAWAVPANIATGGEFAREGLGRHVFERMVSPQEGHGAADVLGYLALLPFYLLVIAIGFLPWVLMLPATARALWQNRLGGPGHRAFLAGWFLPTFIMMSLVATKLPHYVLPVWPALAIAVAAIVRLDRSGQVSDGDWTWLRRTAWVTTPAGLLAPIGLMVLVWGAGYGGWFDREGQPWSLLALEMAPPLTIMAVVLMLLTVGAAWLLRRGELRSVAAVMVAAMAALLVVLATWALPVFDAFKAAPPIARTIEQRGAPYSTDAPMAAFGYNDPTLRFYADRREPIELLGSIEAVQAWLDEPEPGVLVGDREALMPALVGAEQRGFETAMPREGPSLTSRSGSPWMTMVVIFRLPPDATPDTRHGIDQALDELAPAPAPTPRR